MPASRWFDVGQAVLAEVQDFYDSAGVALPARRLVTPGTPTWEVDACDGMLAVQIERTFFYEGDLGQQVVRALPYVGFSLEAATIGVHLLRCVPSIPDGEVAPAVADEETAAALILGDVEMVAKAIIEAVKAHRLGGCHSLAMESWTAAGPDGGWAGGITRFRVGA